VYAVSGAVLGGVADMCKCSSHLNEPNKTFVNMSLHQMGWWRLCATVNDSISILINNAVK